MTGIWPWLAVAGVGALHGLNPVSGWGFAAAWGLRSAHRTHALRALLPIGIGHVASVGLVAGAFALGLAMNRVAMQGVAGGLLAVVLTCHLVGHRTRRVPAGKMGLALWSFVMSSAHGVGLMLLPVLMPLCAGNAASREIPASGSMMIALAAVGVHTTAMLAVTGVIALGVCRGHDAVLRRFASEGQARTKWSH